MTQAPKTYSRLLVCLDGSATSQWAGAAGRELAAACGAEIIACHIYGAELHARRFRDMEPGLPAPYQQTEKLAGLREAHDGLIRDGFQALSVGYMEAYVAACGESGCQAAVATLEGRGYVGILRLAAERQAGLVLLGCSGLGAVDDSLLGGTAVRVLRNAPCDVLICRGAPAPGPIVAGVDGSEAAIAAAERAAALSRALQRPLRLAAAYDPDFHATVFRTMAGSLSAARQDEVGLANQEQLHDEIINDGLRKLYADFLADAGRAVAPGTNGIPADLLTGKPYPALNRYAAEHGAGLLVVGRHGYHHEPPSDIGSNAEALARTAPVSVLVVGGRPTRSAAGQAAVEAEAAPRPAHNAGPRFAWEPHAEARLERVPAFVRRMARGAVEKTVRERGGSRVTAADFDAVAARFGMRHD